MEEHIVTVTIRSKGEICELNDEQIKEWYKSRIAGLFNPDFGTPEITVQLERKPLE